jgi:protocatechuate 3,4-dioxygenase beta subunit
MLTRRVWFQSMAGAVAALISAARAEAKEARFGAQLPPQFGVPAAPPCDPNTKPTPARPARGFQPGAPWQKTVVPDGPGTRVTLEGAVIGLRCGFIKDAIVDIWIGTARGRQRTDANGRYAFEVLVPPSSGSMAPRVNMRVDVPAKQVLTTYLFLPDEIKTAQNKRDRAFDPLLQMKIMGAPGTAIRAKFDVILDL